jgi:osmotically-inducible protein OsmY
MINRIMPRTAAATLAVLFSLGGLACRGKQENANNVNGAGRANGNTAVVTQSTPATASQDTALKNTVEANLTKYGVSGVTVEAANGEVTLRGNVARAKLPDAMKAANEAGAKKVNNQMNIQ